MDKVFFLKNKFVLLIIALVIAISCTKKDKTEDSDYIRITSLARSFSYEQIVTEFSSYPWNREKDPSMLMVYCKAIVETGNILPASVKSPPLPTYMAEFTQGYFDLLSGRLQEAVNRFLNLINLKENHEGQVWGNIGFLEFALYTESIANMEVPLKKLQFIAEQNPSTVSSWVIPHYSVWYYFNSGKFSEVDNIIQKYNKELDPITLLILQVELLVRDNRFEEAEKAIKNLPPDLSSDQDVIALEADIINLKHGLERWMKYLYEKHKQFPKMWLIEQRYGEALLESGQTELGIEILKKIAQKRTFDVITQLYLAEDMLGYGKVDEAKEIFSHVRKKSAELPHYSTYYNFLSAKIFHIQKKEEEAQKSLSLAMKLYPKAPRFLWLMFDIAMKKRDYNNAHQTFKEILELYPNEVSALASMIELNYLRGEWGELFITEKKISQSPRYVGEDTWDKVKSFKVLALAAEGKFDEAQNILAEIKKPDARAKASAEIDKLRKVSKMKKGGQT